VVSPKSDGIRMFLVTMIHQEKPIACLGNRTMTLHFAESIRARQTFFKGTLLDGEYLPTSNHFLIFDCFAFNSIACRNDDYLTRLRVAAIALDCVTPSAPTAPESDSKTAPTKLEQPLTISIKPVFDLAKFGQLVKQIVPKLPYKTDGYIFTPMSFEQGLHPGADPDLLKWKPNEQQTCEFKLNVTPMAATPHAAEVNITLWAYLYSERTKDYQPVLHQQKAMPISELCARFKVDDVKQLDGKIVECNQVNGSWNPLHVRDDKANPNTQQTVKATLDCIKENITIAELVQLFTTAGTHNVHSLANT
jgi:hypothetical protein